MTTNGKARQPGATGAGLECNRTADHPPFPESVKKKIACRVWAIDYSLEMARQKYADRPQVWKQAGICILIGVLRFVGVAS